MPVSATSTLRQAPSTEAVPGPPPPRTCALHSVRGRHVLSQGPPGIVEDARFPMPTLEARLMSQKKHHLQQQQQQQQQRPFEQAQQFAHASNEGSGSCCAIAETGSRPVTRPLSLSPAVAAAAPPLPPSVAPLATDLAHKDALLLKPRRTSPAALPADFQPSMADVVVELCSESTNVPASSSGSFSSVSHDGSTVAEASSSSPAAAANECRRVGPAPALEAVLNRHLLAYIESSRQARSHLVDHVLALVQRSGGLFCRYDASCRRWIQVGYQTSFDLCASEFKAGAKDVLKRIQLLRKLERLEEEQQQQQFSLELFEEQTSIPMELPDAMRTEHQHASADSKPPPLPLPRPMELHQPPTMTSHEPPSSQLSVAGSIESSAHRPGPVSSREYKLQTKFKRPKLKAPPPSAPEWSDPASCGERATATRPTSPMPRRVTNEQEPSSTPSDDVQWGATRRI
jgi:hypothetical protein